MALALGIGSIIGSGAIAVASGGTTAAVTLPLVIDGIKWLTLGYLGFQGSQDAINIFKTTKIETPKDCTEVEEQK